MHQIVWIYILGFRDEKLSLEYTHNIKETKMVPPNIINLKTLHNPTILADFLLDPEDHSEGTMHQTRVKNYQPMS